jgi:uncharacterized membrane protein YczE
MIVTFHPSLDTRTLNVNLTVDLYNTVMLRVHGVWSSLVVVSALSPPMTRRWVAVVIGQVLIGLSAGALIAAGFSADPYSVLIDGAASTFGVLHVIAAAGCAVVVIVTGRLLGGRVTAVTVVAPVCSSLALQAGVLAPPGVLTAVIAIVGYWAGLALYLGAGLGAGAVEFVAVTVADRYGRFPMWLNALLVVYTAAGVILGGTFGLVTVVLAASTGPMVERGRRIIATALDR